MDGAAVEDEMFEVSFLFFESRSVILPNDLSISSSLSSILRNLMSLMIPVFPCRSDNGVVKISQNLGRILDNEWLYCFGGGVGSWLEGLSSMVVWVARPEGRGGTVVNCILQ